MHRVKGACVDIECLVIGMIENNVYIISNGESNFIVDPSAKAELILEALGDRRLDAVLLTHHHHDHMGAAFDVRAATGAPVIASAIDAPSIEVEELIQQDMRKIKACPVDQKLNDGDVVTIGSMAWKAIATPGHTKGSMCFYMASEFGNHPQGNPVLISGDTLFQGTIGRTDFEGGSMDEMRQSLKRLAALPDNTLVLPGHNDQTTIGAERLRVFATFA